MPKTLLANFKNRESSEVDMMFAPSAFLSKVGVVKMSLAAVSVSVLRCFSLATTARATAGLGGTCSSRLLLGRPLQECCYFSSPVNSKIKVLPSSPLFARDLSAETAGEVTEPPLPPYVPRKGEEVEVKRARLLYQSRYVVESVESPLVLQRGGHFNSMRCSV